MIDHILEENARRRRKATAHYDPEAGFDSPGKRFTLSCPELDPPLQHIPVAMRELPEVRRLIAGDTLTDVFCCPLEEARLCWFRLRCEYDFPFWAFKTMSIKQKNGGGLEIPFVLNAPQRKLIGVFESMREEGLPIRVILVKARQWGGSTATQLYMLWIQLMCRKGFNSLIVGHQAASTEEVIAMAKRALDAYPRSLLAGSGEIIPDKEKIYVSGGMSRSAISIPRRNFRIKAGSAERPDSSRGGDYALVHLTEVGIWKKTQGKSPEDIIRAATSGVLLKPDTMIVMESTANGVGNFFHKEYDAACRGASIYRPVFVAWFEIEQYADKVDDPRTMAERIYNNRNNSFSSDDRVAPGEYIWSLWNAGAGGFVPCHAVFKTVFRTIHVVN